MSNFEKLRRAAHEHINQCCQTLCDASIVKKYIAVLERRLGIKPEENHELPKKDSRLE